MPESRCLRNVSWDRLDCSLWLEHALRDYSLLKRILSRLGLACLGMQPSSAASIALWVQVPWVLCLILSLKWRNTYWEISFALDWVIALHIFSRDSFYIVVFGVEPGRPLEVRTFRRRYRWFLTHCFHLVVLSSKLAHVCKLSVHREFCLVYLLFFFCFFLSRFSLNIFWLTWKHNIVLIQPLGWAGDH